MTATPAPWHMAVEPSDVDAHEEERPTGLIVHHQHDHTDDCPNALKRGVVVEVGTKVNSESGLGFDFSPGDVIFYHKGVRLRGLDYVYPSYDNMIAYEKHDDA